MMDPCPFHNVAVIRSPRSTLDSVITWGLDGTGPLAGFPHPCFVWVPVMSLGSGKGLKHSMRRNGKYRIYMLNGYLIYIVYHD